jgi:hypothetical protein
VAYEKFRLSSARNSQRESVSAYAKKEALIHFGFTKNRDRVRKRNFPLSRFRVLGNINPGADPRSVSSAGGYLRTQPRFFSVPSKTVFGWSNVTMSSKP